MKQKIVFIDSNLNVGGAERILCTLIRNIDREIYDVEVIITGVPGEMSAFLPSDIKCTILNIRRSRYAFLQLAKLFRKIKPDAVFSVSYNSAYAALLARFITRQHFRIAVRHCLLPKQMIREGFTRPGTLGFKLGCLLMKQLDCIIAEHKYMEAEVAEVFGIGKNTLTSVLNPLDEPLILAQSSEQFALPKDQINIVAAGRINKEKGFDFLVEAFFEVVKADSRFHLYIIGKDINGNQSILEERIKQAGCSENIHFEGFQTNPYKYFQAADLYALSSRWEASPNVIFENLYMGKRIAATDCCPILKDIIGDNGVLVPFGDKDAMARAILNYRNYSTNARKFYSLEEFFQAIIGSK